MSTWNPNQNQLLLQTAQKQINILLRWLSTGIRAPAVGEEIIQADDVKISVHVFLGLLTLFCVLFLLWAAVGKLDIASIAPGEVFPSTQLKQVQHLEGGIVEEILVKEGDQVKKDQPLVILESTASGSDVQQLAVNIASLRADTARLEAEIKELQQPLFPDDLSQQYPNAVIESKKLFTIRRQRHQSEIRGHQEQVQQKEHALAEVTARLKKSEQALKLLKEQITISEDLLRDELTNRYNHLELLRQATALESRIDEDKAAMKQAQAGIDEKKSDLQKVAHDYQEEVSQKLEETRLRLDEFTQKMEKYKDSLRRTILNSPVDGVVKQLYVFTKGGVVKPGETVLDIIPSGDQLIVDARLPVHDIGYVQVGQSATIRLTSAEARRFDNLSGKVISISPDTLTKEGEEPYYKVRIETARDYFQRGNLKYKLYPGVQVTVGIITGQRTVLSYLLDPFFGWTTEVLHER